MKKKGLLLLLLCICLLVVGCGKDDDDKGDTVKASDSAELSTRTLTCNLKVDADTNKIVISQDVKTSKFTKQKHCRQK